MESLITDNLPIDVQSIMTMLFEKGNIVNNFKLVGNDYGFSFTLHFSNTSLNPKEKSPLLTPRSKRHKIRVKAQDCVMPTEETC